MKQARICIATQHIFSLHMKKAPSGAFNAQCEKTIEPVFPMLFRAYGIFAPYH